MEPTPLGSPSCFPPPALNCSDLPTRLAPPPWVLNKPGTSLPEEGGPGQQRREALAFVSMGVGERSMTITSSSLSSGTPPQKRLEHCLGSCPALGFPSWTLGEVYLLAPCLSFPLHTVG